MPIITQQHREFVPQASTLNRTVQESQTRQLPLRFVVHNLKLEVNAIMEQGHRMSTMQAPAASLLQST